MADAALDAWGPGVVVGGRYQLEYRLGAGGMGVVWAATHTVTLRQVALKVLKVSDPSEEERRRFLREARAAAAVRHPGIVEIFDVFELEGKAPVMVMELLTGEPLATLLKRRSRLPLGEAASILLQVISAVSEVHALGIVHRDLKPENIFLVGGSAARVKVLDFGIAKLTAFDGPAAPSAELTSGRAMLGTPCYMAPEQAFGERDIDHRADIWALGLILYECLTGVLPTYGDNIGQVLKIIVTGAIRPIEELLPDIAPEVADLVRRMLSRDRHARPLDLLEVAALLGRYGGGTPAEPAVVVRDGGAEPLAQTEPIQAFAQAAAGEPQRRHVDLAGQAIAPMVAATSGCRDLAYRSDGLLATAHESGVMCLWDAVTGAAIRVLEGHTARVHSIAFSPDGQSLVSGSADSTVRLWRVATGQCAGVLRGHPRAVRSVAMSPDGKQIVSAGDSTVRLWATDGGPAVRVLKARTESLRSVAISPYGEIIAAGATDGTISLWDAATGRPRSPWKSSRTPIRRLSFHPEGRVLAASVGSAIWLWRVDSGQVVKVLKGPTAPLRCIAFSADGQALAAGGDDRTLRIWQVATGEVSRVLEGHTSAVQGVAFSPDGRTVALGGDERSLTLWQLSTGRRRQPSRAQPVLVRCVAVSADARMIAAGAADGSIAIWDLPAGRLARILRGRSGPVQSLAFSPDGQTLAAGGVDRTISLWQIASGQHTITAEDGSIRGWNGLQDPGLQRVAGQACLQSATLSQDRRWLIGAARDGTVEVWTATAEARLATLLRLEDGWAAFAPDGSYKLGGRIDGAFWHAVGLRRFEPGELDAHLPAPLRLPDDAPLLQAWRA